MVYGFNTLEQRKSLWNDLKMLVQSISSSWLIIGDFKAILSPKDRLAGAPVTLNVIRYFEEFVKDMGITEVQWKDNYYTWTNKQIGNARIASRIDRAFGNDT